MKITINTTFSNIEMANFLLAQAYTDAVKNEGFKKAFKVTDKDLAKAETFRMALLKSFKLFK